jgi:predicted SAM-dependent methyltransferase
MNPALPAPAMRLHIGGEEAKAGWRVLNVQAGPAVDYVGDCTDLSRFEDGSVDEIYISHVLEHLGYIEKLPEALAEMRRVLKPGGRAMISVPDFEVVCRLFLDPRYGAQDRLHIMRMAFGGQMDPHDFHYVGLTFEILGEFLLNVGFAKIDRVQDFGLFNDTSVQRFDETPISLNIIAWK